MRDLVGSWLAVFHALLIYILVRLRSRGTPGHIAGAPPCSERGRWKGMPLRRRGLSSTAWRLARYATTALMVLVIAALGSACSVGKLRRDLKELDQAVVCRGNLSHRSPAPGPIVVFLYAEGEAGGRIDDYVLLLEPGEFSFRAPPGEYYLAAFEDANRNLKYEQEESAGHFGAPTLIDAVPGSSQGELNIVLEGPLEVSLNELLNPAGGPVQLPPFKRNVGVLTTLDDERFSEENGKKGLWEPFAFVYEVEGGLFFLEEYSPSRIPILFVHGAGGNPRNFEYIVSNLDRSTFQPWLFFYPSGIRLVRIGEYLNELVLELHHRYRFDRLYVVAHSMGGLVSRSFINQNAARDRSEFLSLFVTIATPWRGVDSAALGVKYSPAVVPSWRDMEPDSEFLATIFAEPLPPQMSSYLLFGHKGGRNPFTEADDGSVAVSSMLDIRAQTEATKVYGFDEDHVSILSSELMMEKLEEILGAAGR
jgi:pimeloyl-ACP methyl ester carboxylesterase